MLEAYANVFYTAGICLILAKGQDGSVLQHSAPKQNSTLEAFQPQQECKMLHTNVFQLDLGCVLRRKSRTTAHALTAPSLAACKRVCCEYEEGPCDLVYYNRYHKCVVMNYHVLSLCPLMAPTVSLPGSYSFTLLLSVTERVTPSLKQHLILKGYSSQIAQFLGCDRDSFVCNNWQCIDKKYVCDDTPHCSDNSDESRCPQIIVAPRKMGCLSYHGDYVKNGEEYTPFGKADECQRCICGNDSLPSYCYSATCNNVQLTNCDNNNPDICCVCHKSTIQNNDPSDDNSDIFVNLSGTQRLIVSCMSVLVVVTLLLFFSRNLMHRARGAFMPNGGNHRGRSRNTWVPHPTHALPPTRPFMGRYFTRNSSMSFVETDHSDGYVEPPPAYNTLKPSTRGRRVSRSTSSGDSPPSYDASFVLPPRDLEVSSSCSTNRDDLVAHSATSLDHVISAEPITSEEPLSPVSVSSCSPLIAEDGDVSSHADTS